MSRNNTRNPLGSKAFLDFEDNVKNLDQGVNSDQDTFQDRMGKSRLTWTGIVKAGSGDPAIAVDAAARAEAAASQVQQDAEQIAADAAQQAVTDVVDAVDGAVDRAESAADAAQTAADAAFINADVYPDVASGRAAVANGEQFQVVEGDEIVRYRRDSSSAQTEVARYPSASSVRTLHENMLETVPGKNLINKDDIVPGEYYSNGSKGIITGGSWRRSGFIPVVAGRTYTTSGNPGGLGIAFLAEPQKALEAIHYTTTRTVVAPEGARFAVVNITNTGIEDTTYDSTIQLEEGTVATPYSPYERVLTLDKIKGGVLRFDDVLEITSFNLIDPAAANYINRYSRASQTLGLDTAGIAASDYIPVREGEFYTLSGDGVYSNVNGMQGGFFVNPGDPSAVQNIIFASPPVGPGQMFQVPEGLGIGYVVLNLWKAGRVPSGTSLDGNVQLEAGEMATPYQPYGPVERVKPELLTGGNQPPAPTPSGGFNSEAWYTYTNADDGHYLSGAFPVFRRHWIMRDKDLCVVNTGTSLTARSAEHCTDHPEARVRPPLMHSRNMASILWDRLRWDRQEYRRYDYPGAFTESGAFSASSSLPEWDDGSYRQGWTRYSQSASAAVTFAVPADAWQFNFIYRTDATAVESNLLTVAEGNGYMEVFDETSDSWVEANGFVFTMRESIPVPRDILVPRASTGEMVTRNIPSKGNTTYQKRLKLRCKNGAGMDSRGTEKAVSITAQSAGRFMYWGVEWTPREFMVTYINAARGSHNTQADTGRGLPKWQDNEIWSFKPDLLFFELPIHNDGASGAASYTPGYWARLTDHFVFKEDYELSLKTRGAHFGLTPEIGMFTSSIAWNFGGITEDGKLKTGEELGSGKILTALDKFNEACIWVWDNHPEAICINAAKRWVDAGEAIFGDLRTATEGSGRGGHTFTNEGSHWNDTGSKIIAKVLVPLFDFTHP